MESLIYRAPCGFLRLVADETALMRCDWVDEATVVECVSDAAGVLAAAAAALDVYFAGERLPSVPLRPVGTAFQMNVWRHLAGVGPGEVLSYGRLAAAAGMPRAVRAVANAVGANPLSIFIPCHRIVGASSMGGYAGGRSIKKWLLEHEALQSSFSTARNAF